MENEEQPKILSPKATLVLVGFGLLLILVFSLTSSSEQSLPPVANPPVQISVREELPEVDASGWQTYRNDEFGFEVKYPEDRKGSEQNGLFHIFTDEHKDAGEACEQRVTESAEGGVSEDPCLFGIFISIQSFQEMLAEYIVEGPYSMPLAENILKLKKKIVSPDLAVAIPLQAAGNFIVFEAYDDVETLEKILTTFRFAEE